MPEKVSTILLAAVLSSLPLVACSGSSEPNVPSQAVISLDRDPIVLPAAYVGTIQPESFQILNQGRGLLTVTSVQLLSLDGGPLPLPDAGGVFTQPLVAVDAGTDSDPLPVQIAYDMTGFVQFYYSPTSHGPSSAMLVIQSNAPMTPTLTATVTACAVAVDAGPSDSGTCQ